jgi:predicted DNA-binding transcriptional regulator YafY
MYHPTTRVLTILELLQSHPRLSGPELAARLEVDVRTVRRYIGQLQDLGIPVEAAPGRYGGYRLRAGFRLPPLMFTNDEIVVLTLGLLNSHSLGLAETAPAVESALAKIGRVLPVPVARQLAALHNELTVAGLPPDEKVDTAVLTTLGLAATFTQPVRLTYHNRGEVTERLFEPYGVVHLDGRWYTVGYCHLRQGVRIFRLDRVRRAETEPGSFTRPAGFDALAYLVQSIATIPDRWDIEVELGLPIEVIRSRLPPTLATLEPAGEKTLFRSTFNDLDWLARHLVGLGGSIRVIHPPELRAALQRLALEIAGYATAAEPPAIPLD